MQQTVGTSPVPLGAQQTMGKDEEPTSPTQDPTYWEESIPGLSRPVIQNLGPGELYLDFVSDVATGTGYKIDVGESLEFVNRVTRAIYAVATADTDVRFIDAG